MKILWVGDFNCSSGFARLTHAACGELHAQGHEVHVLGINFFGDPHDKPYAAYPSRRMGAGKNEDGFGITRTGELVNTIGPDVVVIVQDHWNFKHYLEKIPKQVPVIGCFCVDGGNIPGVILNPLALSIFSTRYGQREAEQGGLTSPSAVIPYGVTDDYFPGHAPTARKSTRFPDELSQAFIVGSVARNSSRKRLDLTIRFFTKWLERYPHDDAYLFLHSLPGLGGWDLEQLGDYYGLKGKLLLTNCQDYVHGYTEEQLCAMYQSMNVYVNTAQGEGWGLPIMEAMACGVPCIVPDWSALGDWAKPAHRVPCTSVAHTTGGCNVVGGIPDEVRFIEALETIYNDKAYRNEMIAEGLDLVAKPEYVWQNIARRYCEEITNVVAPEVPDGPSSRSEDDKER